MAGQVSPEELRGNPKSPAAGAAGIILDVKMGKTQEKRDIKNGIQRCLPKLWLPPLLLGPVFQPCPTSG